MILARRDFCLFLVRNSAREDARGEDDRSYEELMRDCILGVDDEGETFRDDDHHVDAVRHAVDVSPG